jgi:hypothetical protein
MRNLKHFIPTVVLFFAMITWTHAAPASSQQNDKPGIQGYFFVAPSPVYQGNCVCYRGTSIHFGGGADFLLYKGFGAGAELGHITAPNEGYFNGLNTRAGIGLFSANGYYFLLRKRKLSPFGTLGYTLGFGGGQTNFINFGGGANYWINSHVGLLLEFREYINHKAMLDSHLNTRILSARFGLSFR